MVFDDSVFENAATTIGVCITLLFVAVLWMCHRFYKNAERLDAPMGLALSTCFWYRSLAGACMPLGVTIGLRTGQSCHLIDAFSRFTFVTFLSWSVFALQIVLRVVENPFLALGGIQKKHLACCMSWIALALLGELIDMNATGASGEFITALSLLYLIAAPHLYFCTELAAPWLLHSDCCIVVTA